MHKDALTRKQGVDYELQRDGRFLAHLPSHHWNCPLSTDVRDVDKCWKHVSVETLSQQWDKLNYSSEMRSEVDFGEKLIKYYKVELPGVW